MNTNGEKEKLSKSVIIYKNGNTKVLEDWHVEYIIPSMEILKNNNTRSIKKTTTEQNLKLKNIQKL